MQADLQLPLNIISDVLKQGAALDTVLHPTQRAAVGAQEAVDDRPGLVVIANVIAPYRANLHRVLAAGIPEFKLHTLITHGVGDFDWRVSVPPEIHLTNVSVRGDRPEANLVRTPVAEWQKANRLIDYLKQHDIRAVMFSSYRYLSYYRVMNYLRRADIPFFVQLDSNIRSEKPLSTTAEFVKRRLYSWWVKRASGVFSMGILGDQYFLKYGADPKRLYRVPCWPDYDAFAREDPAALARFQRKFGLDGGRRYILFSGRLAPEKRVDLLIDAFAAVASQRPTWDLLIVGDGPLSDELHRRVPEALRSRVVWTGFVDGAENEQAFHAAEALVLPSDREPWALVIQEGMAAGLVVISSDIPGATYEIVKDRRSGRIFPAGDLECLKESLLDVTSDDALPTYKRESRAALAEWRTRTDPAAEVRRALVDSGVDIPRQ